MTPEEKSLLERTHKLAEENNAILRSMRRSARWGTAFKVAYWAVIIALSVGAYYAIQPYVNFMTSELGNLTGLNSNLTSTTSAVQSLKSFISPR